MNFLETSPALTRADISKVERELNVVFPDEFIAHYLNYNGGYPENFDYTWKTGETTTVNTFLSMIHEGFVSFETTYKNLAFLEHYLPLGMVPFAVDNGANIFCISTREKDFGKVFYLNNDNYDDANKEAGLTRIEDSFFDFLNALV